ncbi:MAG: inorganic phosphate transporter, partial [bacterium]|nr:inorganic phosphate transporter [bacterium]
MAWGIGANDFSNSVGPAVGAKVLSVREAIIVAIIFELAGALFYGAHVTETLTGNIIDLSAGDSQPMLLVHGML